MKRTIELNSIVEYEEAPEHFARGFVNLMFLHRMPDGSSIDMYVILKATDNLDQDAIYVVRSSEQLNEE